MPGRQRKKASVPKRKNKKNVKRSIRAATPTVKGRGGYSSGFKNLGAGIGSLFGPAGTLIGSGAGELLGTLFGRGAYKLRRNTLAMGNNGPPVFGDGSIVVSHCEFISDIVGTTGFSNYSFRINPGSAITFPWLSQIALSFQNFEFMGLVFEYRTTSATAVASTNTALGAVVMATNYDADAPQFLSKQQMEAYEYATSTTPSATAMHPVECSPVNMPLKTLYVQSPNQTNSDRRFMDLGEFNIATVGMQAAATIGELWVTYQVKLSKPALPSLQGLNDALWTGYCGNGNSAGPFASCVNTQYGTMQAYVAASSSSALTIPQPGYYLFYGLYTGSGGAIFNGPPTFAVGSNIHQVYTKDWTGGVTQTTSAFYTGGTADFAWLVQVTAPGNGSANQIGVVGPSFASGTNFSAQYFLLCVPPNYAALSNDSSNVVSATAPGDGVRGTYAADVARAMLKPRINVTPSASDGSSAAAFTSRDVSQIRDMLAERAFNGDDYVGVERKVEEPFAPPVYKRR